MGTVSLSMNLKSEMKINSPEYEGRRGGGSADANHKRFELHGQRDQERCMPVFARQADEIKRNPLSHAPQVLALHRGCESRRAKTMSAVCRTQKF
jgi:hypothetical protein